MSVINSAAMKLLLLAVLFQQVAAYVYYSYYPTTCRYNVCRSWIKTNFKHQSISIQKFRSNRDDKIETVYAEQTFSSHDWQNFVFRLHIWILLLWLLLVRFRLGNFSLRVFRFETKFHFSNIMLQQSLQGLCLIKSLQNGCFSHFLNFWIIL